MGYRNIDTALLNLAVEPQLDSSTAVTWVQELFSRMAVISATRAHQASANQDMEWQIGVHRS